MLHLCYILEKEIHHVAHVFRTCPDMRVALANCKLHCGTMNKPTSPYENLSVKLWNEAIV